MTCVSGARGSPATSDESVGSDVCLANAGQTPGFIVNGLRGLNAAVPIQM
jgi:hypothetical protein